MTFSTDDRLPIHPHALLARCSWTWALQRQLVLAVSPTLGTMADEVNGPPRTQVHGERTIYDNEWVRLVQVDIEPPDGHRFWHHVVRLQTVALAAVFDDQDRVLMIWRHRFVP